MTSAEDFERWRELVAENRVLFEQLKKLREQVQSLELHHQNEHANCTEYYRAIDQAYECHIGEPSS